jgi:hypothetical protein
MRGLLTFACAGVLAVGLALSPKAASALPATPALNADAGSVGVVEQVKSKKWNKKYGYNRNWNRGRYAHRGYGYRNYGYRGYRNYGYYGRPYGYYGYRRPGVSLWFGL